MSRENFQYDGLIGLTFFDEDGNAMPAEGALLEKAKSFGGNRSEAARYAARVRWGNRQAKTTVPDDGDPIYDPKVELTARQEEIASLAESRVTDAIPVKETHVIVEQQEVEALLSVGFKGNGEPPEPPDMNPSMSYLDVYPDYHLLPKEHQAEAKKEQERIIAEITALEKHHVATKDTSYEAYKAKSDLAREFGEKWSAEAIAEKKGFEIRELELPDSYEGGKANLYGGFKVNAGKNAGKIVDGVYHPTQKDLDSFVKRRAKHDEPRVAVEQYRVATNKWMGVGDYGEPPSRTEILTQHLGEGWGWHKGAQTVSGQDFDALAKSGRFYVVWRGTSKETIDSYSTTHPTLGGGVQGVGIYTTYYKNRATLYGDGEETPMLIPKTAIKPNRMYFDIWDMGSNWVDPYANRRGVSHGESENFETGDFCVRNISMLIIGPRSHDTPFIPQTGVGHQNAQSPYKFWLDDVVKKEHQAFSPDAGD